MRALMHIALFLLAFSLEVTVNAAEILEEPKACLSTSQPCAVQALDEKGYTLKLGDATVVLDRGASVIRKSATELRLVDGTVWIKGDLTVSTEFGSTHGTEEVWVTKNDKGATVMVVRGEASLSPRGSKETLMVGEGLQNTMSDVGFNGVAQTGLPMPILFKDFVMRWGRLYTGPKADFETQVDRFHAKWRDASAVSAETNRILFERKVASVEEKARLESEKRAKVEAEASAERKMFRARMLQGR